MYKDSESPNLYYSLQHKIAKTSQSAILKNAYLHSLRDLTVIAPIKVGTSRFIVSIASFCSVNKETMH